MGEGPHDGLTPGGRKRGRRGERASGLGDPPLGAHPRNEPPPDPPPPPPPANG